jgi:ATP-binding cassette subfamily B (MDR/TAP) protein 1
MIADNKDQKNHVKVRKESDREEKKEIQEFEPLGKEEKTTEKMKSVGFFKLLFTLANKADVVLIICAILGSLIAGAAMPLISLLLGKVLNQFDETILVKNVPEMVSGLIINFLIVGVAILFGSGMMVFFWNLTGRRMINKINADYFKVIMLQEQAWYDSKNKFEFSTKVQSQIKTIEGGVSYLSYLSYLLENFLKFISFYI